MIEGPDKITVYVYGQFHRELKTAASSLGMSLSDFMVQAATRALRSPDRRADADRMDRIRNSVAQTFSAEEIRSMREERRRY